MNTLCHCGRPLFEHASDYMVREGHACRGDCQKVKKGGLLPQKEALPVQSGGSAKEGLEDILQGHLDLYGIQYEREFRFDPNRRWRADFFVEPHWLIEVEGLLYQGGGRHQTYSGMEKDAEKYNQAAKMGFRVLRYTGRQIRSGEALNQIVEAVKEV